MPKTCEKCWLGQSAPYGNNTPGWGNPEAPLVIVLDAPGSQLAEKLLIWLLMRMSLTEDDVWIDYVFKCPVVDKKPKKALMENCYGICWNHVIRAEVFAAKSLVICGNWGVQFVISQKMKELHGLKDEESGAWVCYDFKYLLMNPAECVDNSRVIWKAAEECGLKPIVNLDVPPFEFPTKKLT